MVEIAICILIFSIYTIITYYIIVLSAFGTCRVGVEGEKEEETDLPLIRWNMWEVNINKQATDLGVKVCTQPFIV